MEEPKPTIQQAGMLAALADLPPDVPGGWIAARPPLFAAAALRGWGPELWCTTLDQLVELKLVEAETMVAEVRHPWAPAKVLVPRYRLTEAGKAQTLAR